jgi:TetR/AcrR family acrAB operon transcriptional repressor
MPVLNPSKPDNEAREERILNAAEKLIIHYGYDKTSVSDIAHEAGISKGAIYLHFASKDELFEALLLRELNRYAEKWLELSEADPKGGTIISIYKNTLYAINSNPFMVRIFKQDRQLLGSYIRKEGNLFQRMGGSSLRGDFMKMMQDAGAIRKDLDPNIIAHIMNLFSVAIVTVSDIFPEMEIPPLDATIETLGEMMDRALTPADGGNSEAGKAIIRQIMEMSRQQLAAAKKA